MGTICIRGAVFSGAGQGSEFVKLQWVAWQIKEKVGFVPYPGTLNIRITEDSVLRLKKVKNEARQVEVSPAAGFCRGKCFKASMANDVECAMIVPEVADYPQNIIEVIASSNLRRKLHLKDGDSVEVKIAL